jgi:pSer/pThr/pTyr-binding forkhead associated (FHA) protein
MGVRFAVESAEGKPLAEGVSYGFEQARIAIGRGSSADVRIPHLTVSELHAEVRLVGDAYTIEDRDSTNGTLLNGTRLAPGRSKRLREGDRIEIGAYVLSFHLGVVLSHTITLERTSELARRLFRQSHAGAGVTAPRLVLLTGAETGKSVEIPLPPARWLLGRADTCQLLLRDDPEVGNEHAEIIRDLDGVLVRNLDAKRGMLINEQRVAQRRLRDGDELLFGTTRLLFEEPAEEPMDALVAESDRPLPKAEPAATEVARPIDVQPPADKPRGAVVHETPQRRSSFDADLLIYALAALVIALSVVGLIALIRAE